VRNLLVKCVAAAALLAAVAVPAASAKTPAVKLPLLPLQKTQLGSAAKSLPLQADSGPVSNLDAALHTLSGASPKVFKKMGRVGGYALDYGDGASGGAGVTSVYTEADQYTTASGAKKAVAFWKKDDAQLEQLNQGGFVVTQQLLKTPAVGSGHFAYLWSYSAANIVPVWVVDEEFAYGKYELDVTVWAGSQNGAAKLAPQVSKKLYARLRQALAGKLHGKPVKLPKPPHAGPPSGGPDISSLALQASDVGAQPGDVQEGWNVDPSALSDYSVFMEPAGSFDLLDQEIEWYPTANDAAFNADWANAQGLRAGSSQVDLSGVGDGAQGLIYSDSQGGIGQVVFSSGQLAEYVVVFGSNGVQTTDVQHVAQVAANYINNAGLGS
jgi:hypothetical protein